MEGNRREKNLSFRSLRHPETINFVEKKPDILGIILEVSINRDNDSATGQVEPGRESRRLSVVPPEAGHHDTIVLPVELFDEAQRTVPGAVIDQYHLIGPAQAVQSLRQSPVQMRDALLLVEKGNHNRDKSILDRPMVRAHGGAGVFLHVALNSIRKAIARLWLNVRPGCEDRGQPLRRAPARSS